MPDAFVIRTCPYCETERMTFDLIGSKQRRDGRPVHEIFLVCRRCEKGIVAVAIDVGDVLSSAYGDIEMSGVKVDDIRLGPANDPPEHISEEVRSEYQEASANLRQGNLRSAGMVLRHTLERATRELAEQNCLSVNNTLFDRINSLHTNRLLTDSMRDWAHQIRLIGNEAAHDMRPFEKEEIQDTKEFTEMFLIYAFTLPERIKKARADSNAE